jgi:hypothetical protein
MQKGLTKHDFYLFKGVNAFGEENRIPSDSLFYAENCRFDGYRLTNRMGYQAFYEELTGGTNIKGLINYPVYDHLTGNKEYLLAYYNSLFHRIDPDTSTKVQITPTGWTATDTEVSGISYRDKVYVCDGGTNLIGKIDDETFSVVADSPKAMFLETWLEKLWTVSSDAVSTVRYSRTATASNPEYIEDWTTIGASGGELIGSGGRLTGLKKLQTRLYAFKEDAIEQFSDFDLSGDIPVPVHSPLAVTAGAIGQKSITLVENDIWFLTPNLEIRRIGQEVNYSSDSPRTRDMSNTLARYKKQLDPDQSGAVAVYHKGIYKLSLKTMGSASNNIKFIWDFNSKQWSFDKDTSQTAYCINSGNLYFVTDGLSEKIYRDNVGYSDNGFAMSWTASTSLVDDGAPDVKKHARYLIVRGERSEGAVITVNLLGEDQAVLETHIVPAPTPAEMATVDREVEDAYGLIGDDLVGGFGFNGESTDGPATYRFNAKFSCNSNSRMFGIKFSSSLNAKKVAIDEAKLYYIPRGVNSYNITS